MGAVKNTVKDHNTYVGILIGFFVVPWVLGRTGMVKVNVPKS